MDEEKTVERTPFQKEVMLYLRNWAAWKHGFSKKVEKIHTRLDCIEIKIAEVLATTFQVGRACGTAFEQTKTVINALSEEASACREDLAEYGGTIIESSWAGNTISV